MILIGTGSEVALYVAAYQALTSEGIAARVAVEEAATFGWCRCGGCADEARE